MEQILHFSQWLETCLNGLVHSNLPAFYLVVFFVVFCETGLVVTPFLPGDSLLFLVGSMAATADSGVSLPLLIVVLTTAAVLGDALNYSIGWRLGPRVFQYEKSWLFNKKHLLRARLFTKNTAVKRSFWPGSCRSCGHSRPSWPASAICGIASFSCTTWSAPRRG